MSLREIVNVNITKETRSASRPGFGIALILGTHNRFTERIRFYTGMDGVAKDFDVLDQEYSAANAIFAQNPSPVSIAIGRRAADVCPLIVKTATNSRTYKVTINGIVFTIVAGANTTKDLIVASLIFAINGGTEPVTATAGTAGTGKITLTADVAGVPFTVINGIAGAFDSQLIVDKAAIVSNETPAVDLTAIKEINDTWYTLVLTSRDEAEVVDMTAETGAANWVEANKKVFMSASSNANNINLADPESTSLMGKVKSKGYERTTIMYHANAGTAYPEAAVFGKILPQTPGSYTVMFKTLSGITPSHLTSTQAANALAKNGLIYQEIGSVPITREGKVGSGEFIDTIIFVDWLETEIQYNVFTVLAKQLKVPMTTVGIQAIATQVRTALQKGLDNGGISPFEFNSEKVQIGGYVVKPPTLSEVSSADKAARQLRNVDFTGWLAGAIHGVQVVGRVTV